MRISNQLSIFALLCELPLSIGQSRKTIWQTDIVVIESPKSHSYRQKKYFMYGMLVRSSKSTMLTFFPSDVYLNSLMLADDVKFRKFLLIINQPRVEGIWRVNDETNNNLRLLGARISHMMMSNISRQLCASSGPPQINSQ